MIRPCQHTIHTPPDPFAPAARTPFPFDKNNGHRLTPAGFKLDIRVASGIRAVRLNFNLCYLFRSTDGVELLMMDVLP